jgi:hypothetical protein
MEQSRSQSCPLPQLTTSNSMSARLFGSAPTIHPDRQAGRQTWSGPLQRPETRIPRPTQYSERRGDSEVCLGACLFLSARVWISPVAAPRCVPSAVESIARGFLQTFSTLVAGAQRPSTPSCSRRSVRSRGTQPMRRRCSCSRSPSSTCYCLPWTPPWKPRPGAAGGRLSAK